MQKLDLGHKEGHWVLLQNIHLMPRWTVELEKKLDSFSAEGPHPNFRCFLSSELCDYIPVGILDRSIKLTNEPPQGLQANLKRAFACFPKDDFDEKDQKVLPTGDDVFTRPRILIYPSDTMAHPFHTGDNGAKTRPLPVISGQSHHIWPLLLPCCPA